MVIGSQINSPPLILFEFVMDQKRASEGKQERALGLVRESVRDPRQLPFEDISSRKELFLRASLGLHSIINPNSVDSEVLWTRSQTDFSVNFKAVRG